MYIYITNLARCFSPTTRLQDYGRQHIIPLFLFRSTMRIFSRPCKGTIGNSQSRCRHYHTDSITGRIYVAVTYHHILPITTGNSVISRKKTAVTDCYILASAYMYSIPPLIKFKVMKNHIFYFISHKSIVGSTVQSDSPHQYIP